MRDSLGVRFIGAVPQVVRDPFVPERRTRAAEVRRNILYSVTIVVEALILAGRHLIFFTSFQLATHVHSPSISLHWRR